ncbi:MAG: hypothetical protein A3G01_01080 [Candidatus Kerfeldbacteria bacterium RIFCSPLOWO2_12_FULL_43_9]|nr:MAG: hypothetical protein A3G01_01080 [Candidatus Kerfeldbacteria bacterium RIFCSPLOWO2_12_FULL_43_9]
MLQNSIDIVMFGMSAAFEWEQGFRNRNFFILQALLKHPRVSRIILVDFVPPTLKRALKEYYYAKLFQGAGALLRGWNFRCTQAKQNLYVYSGISHKPLVKVLTHLGIQRPVLWSYNPLVVDYLADIPHSFFVFDAVDNWSVHSAYRKHAKELVKNYDVIHNDADVIFTVAPELRNVFRGHTQVHWIPNGVDFAHFSTPRAVPQDLASIPHPRLGYTGVIQDRFDVALLSHVVAERPDWHFVLIGDVWPDAHIESLRKYPHVHFFGRKTYDILPAYLQHIDVGIVPHKVNAFTQTMNPLKIYEYLACGKPVVSTPVAGTEMFAHYVSCAPTAQQFQRTLTEALRDDSIERVQQRQAFMRAHTWENRVQRMFAIMDTVH